ncbi:hypothetical protein FB382_004362 [Nocardioides ginsengisegetis]|uniref:Uncharacterized protein n=1 Tax=Nocardioides ginsengisegetis TaxID=661491 RepID=A0A7W3PBK7_9ACTN|nr:hypothetical protein [Nocardioides ginsengisegetis]MBA8805587.1 hypothetical protein [Nocardioides ginsengisegetis]MBA8806011.1 hypothetical protein [Nocardioides ginsengisegetis]
MRVTIEKKTDQLNYEDFLGGVTRIVTIAGVKAGTKEQQYDIAIEGDTRFWRPAVTVLKQLVDAWGDDATEWVGRRAELYGDPEVSFGRDKVGGIRVSRLSHIDGPRTANLTITRGKRGNFTVTPLPDTPTAPPEPTAEEVAACTDVDQLKAMWRNSSPERRQQIEQRVADLNDEPTGDA